MPITTRIALNSVLLPLFTKYLAFFLRFYFPKYNSFVNYEIFEELLDIFSKVITETNSLEDGLEIKSHRVYGKTPSPLVLTIKLLA